MVDYVFLKFFKQYSCPISSVWYQFSIHANLLTHTIYCLTWFLQGPQLRRHLFFLSVFIAKERRPHPADSTLQVHGEIILILHCCTQKSVNLFCPGQCQCIENTCSCFSKAQCFFFPQHCLGCGSGPPVEFRFFWELGKPESGLHQRHQCLCWAAHQTAFTQTAQPLVHTGEHTAKQVLTHASNQ